MEQKILKQKGGRRSIIDNVYRTKQHIVLQHIEVEDDDEEGTHLCSYDTFYPRTPEHDALYEKRYGLRMNIDGRRIRATKCARTYAK